MKFRLFSNLRVLAVTFAATAAFVGCVSGPPRGVVYVRTAPPARIVEVRGVAPGAGHVWIDGYHEWRGNAYVWVPGRWEKAPRANAVWVSGHWKQHRDGWYWIEGRWK